MKKIVFLTMALFLFAASPLSAEEQVELTTTYYLYGACMDVAYQDDTLTTTAFCKAFIQGAVNSHKYLTSYYNLTGQYCFPGPISTKSIIGIFIKFVEDNPSFIEKPAISTLYYALNAAFPCPESQPAK